MGFGKKKRAPQQDIWKDLRSWLTSACAETERKQGAFRQAIG